eukprot:scaffold7994_cov122-Isochrysis_galbana.AAC.16
MLIPEHQLTRGGSLSATLNPVGRHQHFGLCGAAVGPAAPPGAPVRRATSRQQSLAVQPAALRGGPAAAAHQAEAAPGAGRGCRCSPDAEAQVDAHRAQAGGPRGILRTQATICQTTGEAGGSQPAENPREECPHRIGQSPLNRGVQPSSQYVDFWP